MKKLLECVPNFSEGRDMNIIKQITDQIESVEGIRLLDVDPGKATNRTVVTFVGEPEPVMEAAFRAIKKSHELIDMSRHKGEHPRFGATDVCPLIPVSGLTMEETAAYARQLAERVGKELHFPVYLYESAASKPERKNLATVRAGEYEGLAKKLQDPNWMPDYGPCEFNPRCGATAIGARDFLIAYNVNLNTTSTRKANSVAFDVREAGRVLREGDPITGKPVLDEKGEQIRIPGKLKSVKAVGWYIEEYGIAQISMNLTDPAVTPIHIAFDEVCKSAESRGMRVTGSELVGLVPLKALLDAGRYFLRKQERSTGISENELLKIAIKSLGLDELKPFDPEKKIIEYYLKEANQQPLMQMSLKDFADETASESPAPGGGSIAAYVGALGVSLAGMVANLSAHKRGWDERWEEFSTHAEEAQRLKDALLQAVDEDTSSFNAVMNAFGLPKTTPEETQSRSEAIQAATKQAIEVPFKVMKLSLESMKVIRQMAETGNPNSVTDAGVGVLCARAAARGAFMNVQINISSLKEKEYAERVLREGKEILQQAEQNEQEIIAVVEQKMGS